VFFIKDKVSFFESMRMLGFAGLMFGALFWIPAVAFYSGSAVAVGQVVELVPQRTDDDPAYYPKVSYAVSGARTEAVIGSIGREESAYQVGQVMRVRYRPERPAEARVDDFFSLWGLPAFIQGVSMAHIVLWSFVLRFVRRRSAPSPVPAAA
jgi:hypothetical protein